MLGAMMLDRSKTRRNSILLRSTALLLALMPIIYIVLSGYNRFTDKRDGVSVPVVRIEGVIGSNPESTRRTINQLAKAFAMPGNTVAIVINSPGGAPGDAERIRSAIEDLKTRKHKSVDILIDSLGASAAYMIALAGDNIYAGRYAMVGSIGVIMQTWDASELAERYGVRMHTYKSGDAKALGSPLHAPTEAERLAAGRIITTLADMFFGDVERYRGARLHADKATLTSGTVWAGAEALPMGLIDHIATPEEYFTLKGTTPSPVNVDGPFSLSSLAGMGAEWLDLRGAFQTVLLPVWR